MIDIHKVSNKTILYGTVSGKNGSMELDKMVAACGHGISMEDHIKASVESIVNEDHRGVEKKRNKVTSIKIL